MNFRKGMQSFLVSFLIAALMLTSMASLVNASTTSEYKQYVSNIDADTARITFESYCSSTYVYVHYKVNNGNQLNYLMNQSADIWTYDVNGLSSGDVIDYWFTYQIDSTQKDTGWFSYTHGSPTQQKVATPSFSPSGGTYSSSQSVSISCATPDADIRYTVDGSKPTGSSTLYAGPITVSSTQTIKAIGIHPDMDNSDVASATYVIDTSGDLLAKYEPADGKTIIVVGQDRDEMDAYEALSDIPDPAGYMIYTGTVDAAGMTSPSDKGGGMQDLQHWINNKPNSICQLAIDMTDYDQHQDGQDEEVKVADGLRDENIRTMAQAVKDAGKPVFLRIGYEPDGNHNHYFEPSEYVMAYRRVHRIFREEGVNNVAFVWNVIGIQPAWGWDIEAWYPGDDYVDWVGVSWFGWPSASEEAAAVQYRQEAADFAKRKNKPLMIGECAGRAYYPMTDSSNWDNFFQKVFDFIALNDVKMLSYINQDWNQQPVFSDPTIWGDTRIQQPGADYIYNKWKEEISKPRYLNESPSLYAEIGFNPNEPIEPAVADPKHNIPSVFEAEAFYDYYNFVQAPRPANSNNLVLAWGNWDFVYDNIPRGNSWASYNINAASTGSYKVKLNISNGNAATTATIKLNGRAAATVNIPATGDWSTYVTATSPAFNISAGTHTLTIEQTGNGFNIDTIEVSR